MKTYWTCDQEFRKKKGFLLDTMNAKVEDLTFGGGGGGGGGYTVGADILSSADWYHHSIICKNFNNCAITRTSTADNFSIKTMH